jgi:hypothetical protein
MKAWRNRIEQDKTRKDLLQQILISGQRPAQQMDAIGRLFTPGKTRLRVGHITRDSKVRIIGATSPLFQGLMIRAGLAPQP